MTVTVAYVCDQGRLHHMLMSVASWRRFGDYPIAVVDIGLTEAGRQQLRAVAGNIVFLQPAVTLPLSPKVPEQWRAYAFEQKCLVGKLVAGEPDAGEVVVFLDADILVVDSKFITMLAAVAEGVLFASQSAWDADFTWTYTLESIPHLRHATGHADIDFQHSICNSGVWAMRVLTAARVSSVWHRMFRSAINSPMLLGSTRAGTAIGDQEFLLLACAELGIHWHPLPGSFNMQVHERLMPWTVGLGGQVFGNHFGESAEPVRAVHFGCDTDGTVQLDASMIASSEIRGWLVGQYDECRRWVRKRGGLGSSQC